VPDKPIAPAVEELATQYVARAGGWAHLYAATVGPVNGVRLLGDRTVAAATVEQSAGRD